MRRLWGARRAPTGLQRVGLVGVRARSRACEHPYDYLEKKKNGEYSYRVTFLIRAGHERRAGVRVHGRRRAGVQPTVGWVEGGWAG